MDNLVKLDKKEEWRIKKKEWFVTDESDPYDLRYPGKMKQEWQTINGGLIVYVNM